MDFELFGYTLDDYLTLWALWLLCCDFMSTNSSKNVEVKIKKLIGIQLCVIGILYLPTSIHKSGIPMLNNPLLTGWCWLADILGFCIEVVRT